MNSKITLSRGHKIWPGHVWPYLLLFCLLLAGLGGPAVIQAHIPPLPATSPGSQTEPLSKIESQLLKTFRENGQADFFVWMAEKADLSPAAQLNTKIEKGTFVFNTLRETAERTQRDIRAVLDAQGIHYEPFYISNKILVRGGDQNLLFNLAARPDVSAITANHTYQLEEPFINPKESDQAMSAIEPNISFVNADDVWAMGIDGDGTVVAGNDTGLDWDHPAILNQYRGWNGATADHNYNWWDATGAYPTIPNDGHGHGTHTTGTMVGDDGGTNQIGMAPGARTIHCKNMDNGGSGDDFTFTTCFQWDLAPWDLSGQNPQPALAPDAINNSWGYWGGNYPAFSDEIAALQAAGILVEVSAGNEGSGCQSLRSPGDYAEVLTTGSVNHFGGSLPGSLTWFSSRGPSLLSADFMPDIMAPGEDIRSSVPGGGYEGGWSGTSMSGPHVTGLIALMWSANPGLRGLVAETQLIMSQTAVPLSGQSGSNCGGDYTTGPNNDWGYGTIDALAAVQTAMVYGDPGHLAGTVSDAVSQDPIPGVTIQARLNPSLKWQQNTDSLGLYNMLVFSGTYTVTAQLYGYYQEIITGVQVTSFNTTTLNIDLNPAPFFAVSGTVTDVVTGWPLYAGITIDGYPGGTVWTDPLTGQYTIPLAAGLPYTFHVTPFSGGYTTATRQVGPLAGPETEDFALEVDVVACTAPGYTPQYVYFENFENDDGGFSVDGTFTSWAWGVPTSGPGSAHSGNNVWATNLDGNYSDNEFGYTVSPDIDLSAYTGQTIIVSWWQWLQTEQGYDAAFVEASNDGGSTWYTIYWADGDASLNWSKQSMVLDSSFAVSNFRLRFGLSSDLSVTFPGFYVDDVAVGVAVTPPLLYGSDFEANNGGLTAAGTNNSWAWGIPTRGPGSAHSGDKAWATGLDDNYNNNEDSVITSANIDASSADGQPLWLSWWQWLQSENAYDWAALEVSKDGGGSWTPVFGPASGILDYNWSQYGAYLDSSYAVSNLQVRFSLQSDSSVTYPGFYVDDLQISIYSDIPPHVACDLQSGGLVTGNVYDANTGLAVNGAAVSNDTGGSTLAQATPADPDVEDGFYVIFSPAGARTFSATGDYYSIDNQIVNVVTNDVIAQDFNLPAGLLTTSPTSLAATLNMGGNTTVPLMLNNDGGLAASFSLQERDGGFTPAFVSTLPGSSDQTDGSSATPPDSYTPALANPQPFAPAGSDDVCIFKDADPWGTVEVETFLAANAIPYQVYGSAAFETLDFDQCRMIVFSSDQPQSFYNAYALYVDKFEDYVAGGGFLNFFATDAGWNGGFLNAPLPGGTNWNPYLAFGNAIDDSQHPVVAGVPNPFFGDFASHGFFSDLPAEAHVITHELDNSQPTIVEYQIGNGWFIAFGQPLEVAHSWAWDFGLIMENTLIWGYSFAPDIPWLSTDPITGTVAAAGSQLINVTFDAGVPEITQPGDYTGILSILDDTPYQAADIPVTLTVNAPATWGKLTGVISSLERCDEPGGPLNQATVDIEGVVLLSTADDGSFTYWLEQGSYTLSISANGYVEQVANVTLVAGQTTTQNAILRRDLPCASSATDSLNVSLSSGMTLAVPVELVNGGAGVLTYAILETSFDLPVANPPLRSPEAAGDFYSAAAPAGPLSLQRVATPAENFTPETPLSDWYGGADVPGGIVRYAHAQCYEQPDSFYIISGVDGTFSLTSNAWRYDALDNDWQALAPIPAGQEGPTAVCYQGRIYVMGGGGSNQFYIYDIAADNWLAGAPLPRGVWGAAASAWNGQIFLVGGDDDFYTGGTSYEVNIYDIAGDVWLGNGTPLPFATVTSGFVQAGPFLYLAGGWDDNSPFSNVNAVQRYDLANDAWETGPALSSGRADLALAMTAQALYAIGGDENGNGFFDASDVVERLELANWPAGAWTNDEPLPVASTANNAGFCSAGLFPTQVWSVGGLAGLGISGANRFLGRPGESCYSIYEDIPWLSVSPVSGSIAADESGIILVTFDAANLAPGVYQATLVITTNDPGASQIRLPVTLSVDQFQRIYLPAVFKA